jgi:hypothetical protein
MSGLGKGGRSRSTTDMGAMSTWPHRAGSGLSAFGEGSGKADHDLKLRFEANVLRRKPRAFGIILVHKSPTPNPTRLRSISRRFAKVQITGSATNSSCAPRPTLLRKLSWLRGPAPTFTEFRCAGDRYQMIKDWLLQSQELA